MMFIVNHMSYIIYDIDCDTVKFLFPNRRMIAAG